jgi:hypothetical protein
MEIQDANSLANTLTSQIKNVGTVALMTIVEAGGVNIILGTVSSAKLYGQDRTNLASALLWNFARPYII